MSVIRNFIYLDNDKLNSLYSQVFEGVAEAIIESYFGESQNKEEQKGLGKTLEEKVGEVSGISTNKILHDHMYNKFEEKIKDKIIFCNGIYNEFLIKPNSIIKVRGTTRIEDYARLSSFLEEFNDLGVALAWMQREQLGTEKNNAREIARKKGWQLDKEFTKSLGTFTTAFEKDGYEIVVEDGGKAYRGVINRKYLRLSEENIRVLYGSRPYMEWTMVGQVTQIHPKQERIESEEITQDYIKNALSNMFDAIDNIEATFFSYGAKKVYHILPIAVYIENNL